MNIPEKWCIKNCQEVGKWFNKQTVSKTYTSEFHKTNYLHSHNDNQESVLVTRAVKTFSKTKPNFTEITIEQFREYVSKTTAIPVQQDYSYITKLLKTLKIK